MKPKTDMAVYVTYRVPEDRAWTPNDNKQLWISCRPVVVKGWDEIEIPSAYLNSGETRAFAGLTLSIVVFAADGWAMVRTEYQGRAELSLSELAEMYATMKRVDRHMARQAQQNGSPESPGEHLLAFARAMGVTQVWFDSTEIQRANGCGTYHHVDLPQARWEMANEIAAHRHKYSPKAEVTT